jgi:peroxiredoxin
VRRVGWLAAALLALTPWLAAPAPGRAAEPGQEAPDFTLPDLASGRPVRLADYRDRRTVLVNFWATWCEPCREELPTLERLARERAGVLEVLAVNLDAVGPGRVRAFVRELGLTFRVLLDPRQAVPRLYRVRGLPSSVLVDRDGRVRHREIGFRDWMDPASRRLVEDALRPR